MTLLSDPDVVDTGVPTPPESDDRSNLLVLVADERVLGTPIRLLALAQVVRAYRRTGARVVCVIREHRHATFGRGRLWLGRACTRERGPAGNVTPALVAEAARRLRVPATALHPVLAPRDAAEPVPAPADHPELPRILSLLADGTAVIMCSSGAGPAQLASALDAKLLAFDPDTRDGADRR